MRRLWMLVGVLLAGCSSQEVVVVYSPHGQEMLGDYKKLFEAAHPNVRVDMLDMGSDEVYGRIRAEQGRPQADVWWGAPSFMFTQAATEDLLAPYTPTWAGAVDPEFKDPEERWYATYRSPLAILFNIDAHKPEDMPRTWDGLLDPAWQGKISLRKPQQSGTMRTFLCSMILRAADENAGIEWLKQLHASTGEYPESPTLLFDHIKKNPDKISVWLMPDVVMQRVRNGYPFGYYMPEDTPVLTDCIGIVKNAPHPEWAQKFYEFVTTEEALAHQAETYAKFPARNDIPREKLPPKLVEQEIDAMEIDWAQFTEKEDGLMKRWEQEVYTTR
ncbi:MAG: extracellular solute-binding protein [Candidatus Hydrogenedentes bacterium]|nr:extracellular solute-binding protein [Candidatus Hydrogenedentota bacterium]